MIVIPFACTWASPEAFPSSTRLDVDVDVDININTNNLKPILNLEYLADVDHDDCTCAQCLHVKAMQATIRALTSNIIEFVSDASMRERVLDIDISTQSSNHDTTAQPNQPPSSPVFTSSLKHRRQPEASTSPSSSGAGVCSEYSHYMQPQGPCTICGGDGTNAWPATCAGKCFKEMNNTCDVMVKESMYEDHDECISLH